MNFGELYFPCWVNTIGLAGNLLAQEVFECCVRVCGLLLHSVEQIA
jgi:hypothetical protein